MAYRDDLVYRKILPVINAASPHIIKPFAKALQSNGPRIVNPNDPVDQIRDRLAKPLMAYFQLQVTYTDTIIAHRMARRFPWGKRSQITRSKHLQLVWFQFVNLCYLFSEKYKLAAGKYNDLAVPLFPDYKPVDIKAGVAQIKSNLGKYIRARGQHFHEWFAKHEHIDQFALFELVNSQAGQYDFRAVTEWTYQLAKKIISGEIGLAITFMEDFLLGLSATYLTDLQHIITKFNRIADSVNTRAAKHMC